MTERINEAIVRQILADVLDLPETSIHTDTSFMTVEAWDSLAHLNIIMAIEQTLAFKFNSKDIPHLTSYQSLLNAIQSIANQSK